MPLAKRRKSASKRNQGAQDSPGSEGNIKRTAVKGAQGRKPPINNKHGRNKSIGR